MPLTYNGITIGKIVIEQGFDDEPKQRFTLQIRQGNCLAVVIHVRKLTKEECEKHPGSKYYHSLYTFFCDEQHLENLLKNEGTVLFDDVVGIELNMYYKENYTLLKYFVQSGYKVKCYYKKPQK